MRSIAMSAASEALMAKLGIPGPLPLIQAPMAGGMTGKALVTAVSSCGCLGSVGAGGMAAADLRNLIRDIRSDTDAQRYSVNLMVAGNPVADEEQAKKMLQHLSPIYEELKIPLPPLPFPPDNMAELFAAHIEVLVEHQVPIVSFVFGLPSPVVIERLRSSIPGVVLIGTATSLEEGLLVQEAGLDIVVCQGSEAGGHRGSHVEKEQPMLVPLDELVSSMLSSNSLTLPIVAAGGIMDGRRIRALLDLGAAGVQMGTAFLVTDESDASPLYKAALLGSKGNPTAVTRGFSGKFARCLDNRITQLGSKLGYKDIPPYPYQLSLTAPLRKAAAQQSKSDLLAFWSGTGHEQCNRGSVRDLIHRLETEFQVA